MPLITYDEQAVRVPISDIVIDGTTIKRQVLLTGMTQQLIWENNPRSSVTLSVTVEHYALGPNDGSGNPSYGERMNIQFPSIDRTFNIVASADTLVDEATGEYLCPTSDYDFALSLKAQNPDLDVNLPSVLYNADGTERNFIKENQFFRRLSDNAPVIVTNLEKQYIQTTADRGKF
jgi:hypothetical protein